MGLSARARRRLVWTLAAAVPVTAIALVVLLVPERSTIAGEATVDEGPAQLADTHVYHLSPADRRRIDALLDRFIPAAVERRSAATAWSLAGPELRASSSLAAWRRGDSPVPEYPARGTRFHYWTVVDVEKDDVLFNILLHPRPGRTLPSYELAGQVIRSPAGWRVNRLYTIATFSHSSSKQTQVVGPNDYAASAGNASAATRKAKLAPLPDPGARSGRRSAADPARARRRRPRTLEALQAGRLRTQAAAAPTLDHRVLRARGLMRNRFVPRRFHIKPLGPATDSAPRPLNVGLRVLRLREVRHVHRRWCDPAHHHHSPARLPPLRRRRTTPAAAGLTKSSSTQEWKPTGSRR